MTTRAKLPTAKQHDQDQDSKGDLGLSTGKSMSLAAGSGMPEIKTILSGSVIPHFLDFKVLLVKAVSATLAVATECVFR